jgi:hypothetical protein
MQSSLSMALDDKLIFIDGKRVHPLNSNAAEQIPVLEPATGRIFASIVFLFD